MSQNRIYTLWAAMREEMEVYPWMLAAEDEASWEGDPDRCEAVFQAARDKCDENGWDYREITLLVDYSAVVQSFIPGDIPVEVEK